MKINHQEDNKRVVREYIETVVNTGNCDNISGFISPDYAEVFNHQKYPSGIEGAKEHIMGVRENYANLKLTIDRQMAEGDWVVTCYTMEGIHVGDWMGIHPTGKRIEVTGVNVDKVVDGKIVEHGGAANLFNSLLEIGAIKIVGKQ
jgi:predicted ester cyclase